LLRPEYIRGGKENVAARPIPAKLSRHEISYSFILRRFHAAATWRPCPYPELRKFAGACFGFSTNCYEENFQLAF
jgi:hypothetical protein